MGRPLCALSRRPVVSFPALLVHIQYLHLTGCRAVDFFNINLRGIILHLHALDFGRFLHRDAHRLRLDIARLPGSGNLFQDIGSRRKAFQQIRLPRRFFRVKGVVGRPVRGHPGVFQNVAFPQPVIQPVLGLNLQAALSIVQVVPLIQGIGRPVVLFQIVGILVADKIPVPIVNFAPLVVGFPAALIIQHQTVLVVDRTHVLQEISVPDIHQDFPVQILALAVGFYRLLLMALLPIFRFPGAVEKTGFLMLVGWLFTVFYLLPALVDGLNHCVLAVPLFIFSKGGNPGCGNLIPCGHISIFIPMHLHRPHQHPVRPVRARLIRHRLQHIGHAGVRVHHGVPASLCVQVVNTGSLAHLPGMAAVLPLHPGEISFQNLADGIVGKLP